MGCIDFNTKTDPALAKLNATMMGDVVQAISNHQSVFKTVVLVVFAILYTWLNRRHRGLDLRVSFFIYAVVIFLCWLPNISDWEFNTDESEWLARSNDFIHDPASWFRDRMHYPVFRLMTYLPLSAMGIFAYPLTWVHAKVFSIVLWSICAVLFKSISRDAVSEEAAVTSAIAMVWWVGLLTFFDFVSYNSELPVVLLVFLTVRLMVRIMFIKEVGMSQTIAAAIAVSLLPFAKEQAVFLSLLLGVSILFILLEKRQMSASLIFILTGFLTVATLITPIIVLGRGEDLIKQVEYIIEYGRGGFGNSRSGIFDRILVVWRQIITNKGKHDLLGLFSIGVISLFSFVFLDLKCGKGWVHGKRPFFRLVVLLLIVSVYSVFHPKTNYPHYQLLMVPSLFLLGMFGAGLVSRMWKWSHRTAVLGLTLALFLSCSVRQTYRSVFDKSGNVGYRLTFSEYLIRHRSEGDRLLVWGWNNAYYVETGLHPASEFIHIIYLNPRLGMADYARGRFAISIDSVRPRFILEAVGEDQQFIRSRMTYAICNFPEIKSRMLAHYKLIMEKGGERLYVRKQSDGE
jgi:hypothetical protein